MVVNLIRHWLSKRPRGRPDPSTLLWSKGYPALCDVAGPPGYWLAPTESCQSEAFFGEHYAGASGLVWVRLSTLSRGNLPSDLDYFVRAALPTIHSPFALITTDGDASVPRDLRPETVKALLSSPWLVSWHTQNHDGSKHPKLFPIPIGLDLHTKQAPRDTPESLADGLARTRLRRASLDRQPLRVFVDLNRSQNSPDRREAVAVLRACEHVDFLRRRVSQTAIWRRYTRQPFVLSAPGTGLDCHRTWELLYLGSIVITKTSSLDPLFDGLPVAIVEDWREVRDPKRLRTWLERYAPLTERETVWRRLRPQTHLAAIRERFPPVAASLLEGSVGG